jgi:CHAT domain-containing protein
MRPALFAVLLLAPALRAGEKVTAVFLGTDDAGKPLVVPVTAASHASYRERPGLLLWATGDGPERWRKVGQGAGKGWKFPTEAEESEEPEDVATALTRGGTRAAGAAGTAPTVQLDPLRADSSARAAGTAFLTPAPGSEILDVFPTFRRMPAEGKVAFPAAKATLVNKLRTPRLRARLDFAEGQESLPYHKVTALQRDYRGGLKPSGEYILTLDGSKPQEFKVADEERAKKARPRAPLLEGLEVENDTPFYAEFALEELLSSPLRAKATDWLGDALDIIDRVPAAKQTPHLEVQRRRVLAVLADEKWRPPAVDPTKIEEIDAAREHLAAGRWRKALEVLQKMPAGKERRRDGLRDLYLAVVEGEGGPDAQAEARLLFAKAIQQLDEPADRFRARVNYGAFLQGQAENRLYNHALQMATGVARPFLTLLPDWLAAREQYEQAAKLADGPGRDGVEVSEARLYFLLADIARTLGAGAEVEGAAVAESRRLAKEVTTRGKGTTRDAATAFEVLAQLDYRAGEWDSARAHADKAHQTYLRHGRLYALENIERLQALVAWRKAAGLSAAARKRGAEVATTHLEIARLLSESFRERFPPDKIGATRAAFLARKAFSTELLAELWIRQDKAEKPLASAEQIKARALQDLIDARGVKASEKALSLDELRKDWPERTAAIEYFFGPEQVWVFVVDPSGKVNAYGLKDAKGEPVSPRQLVQRVQEFLRSLEGYAGRMRKRVLSGRGLDHSWEETLHDFSRELLPEGAMRAIRAADLVVIVPQHILHYFPFAALVTGRATEKHGPDEITRPRFLIEETTLVTAPSLRTWGLLMNQSAARFDRVQAVGIERVPGAEPLPGVERDLANLKSVFKDRLTLRTGDAARKSAVAALLDQPGMLFLATHGLNDPDRPLESHLLLLPDEGRAAAKLTAREIFSGDAPRQPELVVMSACYSGLADRSPMPGDDLFGLQRAFLARGGGSRTVISGLWDVYDDTAPELMLGLFERLRDGEPAAKALAASQRAFLAKYRATGKAEPYLHPYFWAVYTITGDPRTAMAK